MRECLGGAIKTVLSLIDGLREINEQIESKKVSNIEAIKKIEEDQIALDKLKENNTKIIGNFEGLLN